MNLPALSHLKQLEAESIYIFREIVAECERPVMLYSVGKDSSVLVRLAQKAFAPHKIPFPFLHIDTTFKFPEMIAFRDKFCLDVGADLIVHTNHEALQRFPNLDDWTCPMCADLLKTQALVAALRIGRYDAAFGGARRDEEKSRAKERVLSFRDRQMQWDPRNQRPELWHLYNTHHSDGESFRVFPLSNWTEFDVWAYIRLEQIPVVPLYFAEKRTVIQRNGKLLLAGDLVRPRPDEVVESMTCRFRTLGCQLCTGAVESQATSVDAILEETRMATKSERADRIVDQAREASMEDKKREGYF